MKIRVIVPGTKRQQGCAESGKGGAPYCCFLIDYPALPAPEETPGPYEGDC